LAQILLFGVDVARRSMAGGHAPHSRVARGRCTRRRNWRSEWLRSAPSATASVRRAAP